MIIVEFLRAMEEAGDSVKEEIPKLSGLGYSFMLRNFDGLKDRLTKKFGVNLPEHYTHNQYLQDVKMNKQIRSVTGMIILDHLHGYFGEIGIHILLGNNWRQVYEFNDLNKFQQPDGRIGNETYDVKTRSKNQEGLTVSKDKPLSETYYILAHYRHGEVASVRLIGYTTPEELKEYKRTKYGDYNCELKDLHQIEYFTPELVKEGLDFKCGLDWNKPTKTIP
jgi:hypothetical protein